MKGRPKYPCDVLVRGRRCGKPAANVDRNGYSICLRHQKSRYEVVQTSSGFDVVEKEAEKRVQ